MTHIRKKLIEVALPLDAYHIVGVGEICPKGSRPSEQAAPVVGTWGGARMNVDLTRLQAWLSAGEDEHLEFKEARNRYDFEELVKYCVALANEGGGTMNLRRHGQAAPARRRQPGLHRPGAHEGRSIQRLRRRVDVAVLQHPDGRDRVQCSLAPHGAPIQYHGAYWMRGGEDLIPMTPDLLKRIFDEGGPWIFSAEICPQAVLADLDPAAIGHFRAMWQRKSGNKALEALPVAELLADAELVVRGGVTYAGAGVVWHAPGVGPGHRAEVEADLRIPFEPCHWP